MSEERGPLSENVTLDDQADIATVYGIRISGELLRTLGTPTPEGKWFRIVKIEHETATVEQRTDLVVRSETARSAPLAPPTKDEIDAYRDLFRRELDKRMDTNHPSGSPSTEAHQIALYAFVEARNKEARK
jgi:hypothetical protein